MALNLANRFRADTGVDFTSEFWNGFVGEIDLALNDLTGKSASFEEARAELIQAALFRLNEILLPAYERVFEYQQAGFLTAEIADDSEVTFAEGSTTLAIHPDKRDLFRPTPFVALSRASISTDIAIARHDSYDPETGALVLTIVAVSGNAGPHSDVIVSATAASVQAQQIFLTDAKAARDRAQDWAEKAVDVAVETGKFSAKHHATKAAASASAAAGSASTAATKAGEATTAATTAGTARDKAQKWADEAEDVAVEAGKHSAKHWALKAAASAALAALFDPSNYYTKVEVYAKSEVYAKTETYTRAEVDAAISTAIDNLVDGAPGALDTLIELSAALGDDPNFAASMAAAIAAKADAVHSHTLAQISDASANGRSLIGAANYAAMRTLLQLRVGTEVQAFDANYAKTNAAQTWTGSQLFGQIAGTVTAIAASAIDCSLGNVFTKTVNGNITFTTSSVPASRAYGFTLVLTYTSGTITWFSGVQWRDGEAPSFTGGKTYFVIFETLNGGTTWRGAALEFNG
ncbi:MULTISPECIES: hypothetical protein [unclassified Chelatococcus]|uniref:hypothetical protein n=1 Tax=unclassified Chelatococcus TaxID=2638111 RepID=UPI001BCF0F33|nr:MULTISPECIES: hypothetical protein [unclassified Chelatococcus]MBS7737788.1 hypothetical protein [Chelatococcus sp. HY11]MCO5079244.1 hypothetical protein [Chelatococcus sp.]